MACPITQGGHKQEAQSHRTQASEATTESVDQGMMESESKFECCRIPRIFQSEIQWIFRLIWIQIELFGKPKFIIHHNPPLATQKLTNTHSIAIYLHPNRLNTKSDWNFQSNQGFSVYGQSKQLVCVYLGNACLMISVLNHGLQ